MSSFDFVELLGEFIDIVERDWHEFDDSFSDVLFTEIFFLQEPGGDVEQGILWPWEEPVDDSTIDQGRELPGSSSEGLTDWGETDGHVEFLLDLVNVPVPAVSVVPGVDLSF